MYVVDGISYAGEQTPVIKISGIRPLDDYKLWIRFSTGEVKIFDFAPLLTQPAFAPLARKGIGNEKAWPAGHAFFAFRAVFSAPACTFIFGPVPS